jgi:hypothetical protein
MSESTTAPTPAAAPGSSEGVSSPAPITQAPISISDAARLLNQQRRPAQNTSEQSGNPVDATRKPSPNEARAATSAAPAAPPAPSPAPAPPLPAGLAAMEAALGLPGAIVPAPPESTPSPPPGQTQPMAGTVEIDGRHYTPAELREHIGKATDYTKKTQELAQQRQVFDQRERQLQDQAAALAMVLPHIQPELEKLYQTVNQPLARPDLALLETDPRQYFHAQAAYERAVAEQQRIGNLNVLQQQAQNRAMEQQVAAGNEQLTREMPFWGDPQQRLAAQQQIVEWATSKGGYTRAELSGLSSPHHLKAMMKAALFDRWVESAKTGAPTQTVAVARGIAPPPAPSERVRAATDAFEQKADFRTGAALLAARRAAQTNGRAG